MLVWGLGCRLMWGRGGRCGVGGGGEESHCSTSPLNPYTDAVVGGCVRRRGARHRGHDGHHVREGGGR